MKNVSALLRGMAVFCGLAMAQPGWAQGAMQPPAAPGAVQPDQTQVPPNAPANTPGGQTGVPTVTAADLQPQGKITKITILGNKNISTDTIQGVLTEKVGDEFDIQAAEKDRAAVTALGYWTGPAQYADMADGKGGVSLTFTVVENPVVTAIRFNANTATGEPTIPSTTLLAQMQTKPGQVLNNPQLQRDLDTLFAPNTGYASRQGFRFEAGSSINIDSQAGVLTIPIVEAFIQAIIVTGNHRVSTDDILKSISTKPGDVYNAQILQRGQAQISGMSKIKAAGPIQVEQTVPGRVILIVPVTEKG